MKLSGSHGLAVCAIGWSGLAQAQNAKLCDKPLRWRGFKSCADVAKARPKPPLRWKSRIMPKTVGDLDDVDQDDLAWRSDRTLA